MASCVLVTESLRERKIAADLAGFLTPWALHTFNGKLERPINGLTGQKSRKFMASHEDCALGSYFEPELFRLNTELDLGVGRFYCLSLQYGTQELGNELDRLVRDNAYDVIIALDVGGDILARKEDYPWLLTPMVDFSCLSILGGLRSDIDSYLMVAAPGVDGEIPPRNLVDLFNALEAKGLVLDDAFLERKSRCYRAYRAVGNRLNARTESRSNTFRLIEKVLSSRSAHLAETLEKRVSLEDRKWRLSFSLDLRVSLAQKVYCFDLKAVCALQDTILTYHGIVDAFFQLKELGAGGTEVDLSFVPSSIGAGRYGKTVFFLTPPERLNGPVRREILKHGLELIGQGHIPCAIMLRKDSDTLDFPPNVDVFDKEGAFIQVYPKDGRPRVPMVFPSQAQGSHRVQSG
jgi:hypothetical protein